MSGLEMRATNGRLTYVRQTISIDELERGEDYMTQGMPPTPCKLPPEGYFCTRAAGHQGPCAAYSTQTADMAEFDVPEPVVEKWSPARRILTLIGVIVGFWLVIGSALKFIGSFL